MPKIKFLLNRLSGEYSYYHRKLPVKNKPEVFAIELTNYCNLRCSMCPRRLMKRAIGYMDFELFKKVVDEVKEYNSYVWLHDFGESLFHPKIETFIDYCADNGVMPYLSTNATILNDKNALKILNSKLEKIILCLDGATKETYEKIRVNGNFDETKSNIHHFLELKKKMGKAKPHAIVQIIRMKETENEIDAFKREWEGLADEVVVKGFSTWADQIGGIKDMSVEEQRYFPGRKERFPCVLPFRNVVVLWNGDVVPCCLDYDAKLVLGNVKERALDEIWNSERFNELRRSHMDGNYDNPLCKDCLEWEGSAKDVLYPVTGRNFKTMLQLLKG
jgi:radical SAM protein with 4Fe4S-binding SPASM domain